MIHRRKTGEFLLEKEEIMARVEKQQRVLSAEREALIFEKANLERTYKEMIAKVVAEKEEIGHKLKKIQAREKTIEAEFRKKEKQISSLQEKIKKNQEKNSSKAQF